MITAQNSLPGNGMKMKPTPPPDFFFNHFDKCRQCKATPHRLCNVGMLCLLAAVRHYKQEGKL
jgi:hypothetical protein